MERRNISIEVYNKVIGSIPKEVINMLPEEPEKLLHYATRVKEIQISPGIEDDVKKLMKQYLLNDEEYLRTFYYVFAITFFNKHPVETPEIAIVTAQTGSGKSNLTAKLLRKNQNYIFIDSDKYKHFRYDAKDIAKKYPVLYPYLTGPDGYDHAANIYEYATEKKYNIIKETAPSESKGLVELNEEELKEKKYNIYIYILAVSELNSLLSIHERYELQILHGLKTAKLTNISRHDESYTALPKKVREIQGDSNISSINVYMRGTKEKNFCPQKIFPSDKYLTPEKAIIEARKLDNYKTVEEFNNRYDLIIHQMKKRNAPKAQIEQIEKIKNRWKILSKGL